MLKREFEIAQEYENIIETKEQEYIEHLHQLDLHCQSYINTMESKLDELRQQKINCQNEHEKRINELIRKQKHTINKYVDEKNTRYKEIVRHEQLLKLKIENFKVNENQEIELIKDSHQRNIELIHLSYYDKLKNINKKFSHVNFD